MGHTPESVSYSTPNSPTTPGAPIKDESRRPSFDAVSATSSTHHEVSSQGRRGAKKPRSVVNMTQEQRNRKRENDRVAQRAIREKTKQRIAELESIIDRLRNSDHNKDLEAAIRAREASEAENAEIRRQLAHIQTTIGELMGPRQLKIEEHAYASPASQACLSTYPTQGPSSIVSPPASATSPAGTFDSQPRDTAHQESTSSFSHHMDMLNRQKEEMERGLKIGPDRVSLSHLVHLPSHVPGFLMSDTGSGNRPPDGSHNLHPYHHGSPHHYDSPSTQYHDSIQRPSVSAYRAGGSYQNHSSFPQTTTMPSVAHFPGSGTAPWGPDSRRASQQEQPIWATTTLLHERTCTMDDILLKFLKERRDLLAQGRPRSEVVGPAYPSVASLLNKENATPTHPLSHIFIAIIRTFPSINRLPEQLATVYHMFLLMRWQVEPTKENYDRLLPFARPVTSQLTTPHPAWMDHVPFPMMRDRMLQNLGDYDIDTFWVPYTNTLSVNWPYGDSYVLLQAPDQPGQPPSSDNITINPVFDQHIRNVDNWTLGQEFEKQLPSLGGTFKLREKDRPAWGGP